MNYFLIENFFDEISGSETTLFDNLPSFEHVPSEGKEWRYLLVPLLVNHLGTVKNV